MNGKQSGDPAKLADALVQIVRLDKRPFRFAAGADAVDTFERKAGELVVTPAPNLSFRRALRWTPHNWERVSAAKG